jgi:hypothetical protein
MLRGPRFRKSGRHRKNQQTYRPPGAAAAAPSHAGRRRPPPPGNQRRQPVAAPVPSGPSARVPPSGGVCAVAAVCRARAAQRVIRAERPPGPGSTLFLTQHGDAERGHRASGSQPPAGRQREQRSRGAGRVPALSHPALSHPAADGRQEAPGQPADPPPPSGRRHDRCPPGGAPGARYRHGAAGQPVRPGGGPRQCQAGLPSLSPPARDPVAQVCRQCPGRRGQPAGRPARSHRRPAGSRPGYPGNPCTGPAPPCIRPAAVRVRLIQRRHRSGH